MRWRWAIAARYAAIVGALALLLSPVVWMVATAFKSRAEALSSPPTFFPSSVDLGPLLSLADGSFPVFFRNSLIVAGLTVAVTLPLAATAGYAFARTRSRALTAVFVLILVTQMFPLTVLLISIYVLILGLGLLNTFAALVIAYVALALPFMIWFLRGFFLSIPIELEEAAIVDGSSRLGVIRHILVPLSMPGVLAASIFAFVTAWDEYLLALTLANNDAVRTLPPGLVLSYVTQFSYNWPEMMAASLVATLPVIIAFVWLSGRLVGGLISGATKG